MPYEARGDGRNLQEARPMKCVSHLSYPCSSLVPFLASMAVIPSLINGQVAYDPLLRFPASNKQACDGDRTI